MNFSIPNLFNHDRRPVFMADGKQVAYQLDGKWTVRECDASGHTFGPVLFETDSAVHMCAWLNDNQAQLQQSFQDAVRTDPDMTPEQKAKWLS